MAHIRSNKVEFSKIRRWLEFCEMHHYVGCSEAEEATLSGFSLIDRHTRCIVPAPNDCEYIALSYVWGKGFQEPQTGDIKILDSRASLVIEDAITVVKMLNV